MGLLKPALILVLLGSTLLYAEALATDPPPRVGAVKDASRSEPPQPRPKAGTDPQDMARAAEAEAAARARDKDKEKRDQEKKDQEKKDQDQGRADGPAAAIKTDAKGHPVKPAEPPGTGKKPVKRRAVAAQLDDGMNRPGYAPRLAPAPAPAIAPLPPPLAVPSIPLLNGCPNGHCTDASGQRYNPVGTTLISPQGRLCSNNGISVSCY